MDGYIFWLDPQALLKFNHNVIDPMWVKMGGDDELMLHTPLPPCHQLRALGFHADLPRVFVGMEPAVEREEGDAQEAQALAPKVGLGMELAFQHLDLL